jgi:glutamate-1-semialdehyde 2,1-aminomutase
MPAAIYGGREEIMRHVSPDGPVYQAGTLSGNPIATAAGLTTLKILKRDPGIYARLEQKTATLSDVIRRAFGEKVEVTNVASLLGVMFKAGEWCGKATSSEMFAMWYSQLLERGIYVAPSCYEAMFVSDAHSNEDISATIKAIEETAAVMLDPLA